MFEHGCTGHSIKYEMTRKKERERNFRRRTMVWSCGHEVLMWWWWCGPGEREVMEVVMVCGWWGIHYDVM